MTRHILLTFDLEEFDLPLEFGCNVKDEEQLEISRIGTQRITDLLSGYSIPATFFTTSFFAQKNKALIRQLSANHEIASHSKFHSLFSITDPLESKLELELITGKSVSGFRMPHFRKLDPELLSKAGYRYDSSVNPTIIPGRYNNLCSPRMISYDKKCEITEVPVSVSPVIRFPLFWLSFKKIPLCIYAGICKITIRNDSYLHLYFHPWEFADLESFRIPRYIKTPSGRPLIIRFEKLIEKLREEGDFLTVSGYLDLTGKK